MSIAPRPQTATGRIADATTDAASRAGADLALLRAYEPVVRYTNGELFLPTAVGPYVAQCSLWTGVQGGQLRQVVPHGEMTLERLAREGTVHRGRPLFLRFVERPLTRAEYARWRQMPRERLTATGRFTTTGVFGRLIDATLRASLLLRGKVPAGLAAAAETAYRERLEANRFTYYGRVVREGGYVCLQYWFFYAMNDWRSTFGGINDHEADWEMVTIYLAEEDDGSTLQPAWVAFSSHDYQGDDLRRRWDDPELQRDGLHPIVLAGAGSHSGAFIPGDYVVSVDPPQVRVVVRLLRKGRRWLAPWRHYTGTATGLGIPFVDYARGDGVAIGPGHDHEWTPVLVDDQTRWLLDYRGLWGLDTRDRFGGERAPSGPRYERDGTVRTSWANPLGWAGLLKVPPDDDDFVAALRHRVAALDHRLTELDGEIEAGMVGLRGMQAEARSLRGQDYARAVEQSRAAEATEQEGSLNQTIATRAELAEERRVHLATLAHPITPEAPQAHITRSHQPYVEAQERRRRFLKLWAAVSTPLLLASIIVVLLGSPLAFLTTIAVLCLLFSGVEAIARRRLLSFLASTILLLATVALVVGFVLLLAKHWRTALALLVGIASVGLLIGNLQDLRRR
jgi:hypothetical protein